MEWFGSPSRRMVMKLAVSVQLTDDLTGEPVQGSNARVWIEGQRPPIKKPDGRNIFVDLPDGDYVLIAEGGNYTRTEVPCTVSSKKFENLTIRLAPNQLYPVPQDVVRIEGKAAAGSVVRLYSTERSSAYKLLSDAKKGDRIIGIYHPAGVNIEGKLLKITSPEDQGEYIRVSVAEDNERSEYALSGKLVSDYPKIGTMIVPVSECTADEKGSFMLLLKAYSGTKMICEIQSKRKVTQKTIEISDKQYIKVDN